MTCPLPVRMTVLRDWLIDPSTITLEEIHAPPYLGTPGIITSCTGVVRELWQGKYQGFKFLPDTAEIITGGGGCWGRGDFCQRRVIFASGQNRDMDFFLGGFQYIVTIACLLSAYCHDYLFIACLLPHLFVYCQNCQFVAPYSSYDCLFVSAYSHS